ncbi:putative NBD/HSP70 family sugar kinase/putative transcriptional regulator [Clostridium algifaecis]|uniref:NBD/HSP70 family sugar kinase/putative transcriptional regulator n=1 Tax=Clostridium algifaecis TaxID=1472040 RepID=A0ABS4KVK3_9CLOT|nr:ROK family transcriptional regulator [Clostridium algifaecis]MBP2032904.1 putative NBD/HSP70 family sugar kinase/putative transcriptional regulator [Clostridium algifaecis]
MYPDLINLIYKLITKKVKRLVKVAERIIMNCSYDLFNSMRHEEKDILNLLQKNGSMTKNDILCKLKMKLTSLNRLMDPLEENKIIIKYSIGKSSGGRKPVLYDVSLCNFYIIGIEISREYTEVVLTNFRIQIIYKEKFKMDSSFTPYKTAFKILEIINKAVEKLMICSVGLFGIGVSIPGNFENFYCNGWSNDEVKIAMEKVLECPVVIQYGATAAAVAECYYGFKNEFKNVGYFNCGSNIRTGIILNGKILGARNDIEDALGHMILKDYGTIQDCCSEKAITKKFASKNNYSSEVRYKDVCTAASSGDEIAQNVIKEAAYILGLGLANYITMLDLRAVILSGSLIENSKLFYDTCIKTVIEKSNINEKNKVIFKSGGFFNKDAISAGAAAVVVEKYLDNNF